MLKVIEKGKAKVNFQMYLISHYCLVQYFKLKLIKIIKKQQLFLGVYEVSRGTLKADIIIK